MSLYSHLFCLFLAPWCFCLLWLLDIWSAVMVCLTTGNLMLLIGNEPAHSELRNLLFLVPSSPQCALSSARIKPAARTTSAATSSAWAAAWSLARPATAWPAEASSTKGPAWRSVPKTSSPTKAGAASLSHSARTCTTNASGRKSARTLSATSTSSTTAPASPSAPLATPPSTHSRKWTRSSRPSGTAWSVTLAFYPTYALASACSQVVEPPRRE